MPTLEFTVLGDPKGKKRPMVTKKGHTFTPQETVSYENLVKLAFTTQFPDHKLIPAHTPITMQIEAYFHPTKQLLDKVFKQALSELGFKKKDLQEDEPCQSVTLCCDSILEETCHTTRGDIDNIAKIIMDSLNSIAYEDDASVCSLDITKLYSRKPRVDIRIFWEVSE